MSTADLARPADLDRLDPTQREMVVTTYLETARDRLAMAVQATGPETVATIKAEVATVAEMTKQLGLSKECQDDATEMVRRAEYALGKAIRKGQKEGTIRTRGEGGGGGAPGVRGALPRSTTTAPVEVDRPASPYDFAKHTDLYGDGKAGGNGIYALVDNATEEEFEGALTEAREEGNLSRANLVRKVRRSPTERQEKWDRIAELAAEGRTSQQIASIIGGNVNALRETARERGIDIPADRVTHRKRRVNADRILSGVAESVAAAAFSIQQIDPLDLDQEAAQERVDSLIESLTAIRKAVRTIKESLHV